MATDNSGSEQWGSAIAFAEPQWYRGLPSPYYNASHRRLRSAIRAWVDDHLIPTAYDWEEEREPDHSLLPLAARAGILLPLAFGSRIEPRWVVPSDGRGIIAGIEPEEWDAFHDMIIIDELYRCGGLGPPTALFGGCQIGIPPVLRYGSEELKAKVVPSILRGEKRICLAITEAEAGSDVRNLSTQAVKSADGQFYIVTGAKKWITNAVWAEYFTTAVRTAGKPGDAYGISVLLVQRTEGVSTRKMMMGGSWCAGTSYLTFDDVKVPVGNLLGKENEGFKIILSNFNHERCMISFQANRLARVAVEDSLLHAQTRRVFGKPLIENPLIRNKFGNMVRLLESQQAWIESVVYAIQNLSKDEGNRLLGGTTALMKANASMNLEHVVREAVQILGGLGFTRGGKGDRIERIRRDVKGIAIPGGAEEVMIDLSVREGLKLAARQTKL